MEAMKGAVAAGHPLTARAGARVLEEGGNAVDACVAAVLAAWVAESTLTGPGAGGYMLVHRARDRAEILLDFFAAVPGYGLDAPAPAEMVAVDVPFGVGETTQRFRAGEAACAVPGAIAGLHEAHRLFGSQPWRDLVAPAIELARDGVEVTPVQALLHGILDAVFRRTPEGRRIYAAGIAAGDRIAMPDLAGSLELLAERGAGPFYRGDVARRAAAVVQEGGGLLTETDLASYRPIRRRPVRVSYRGHEVVSNPPPSSGGVLIAYALRLLDRVGLGGHVASAVAVTRLAAVARETARVRQGDFVARLHRGGLVRRLLDDERIAVAADAVRLGGKPVPEPAVLPSTTHVSVMDSHGNAASCSSSLGCGSGVFVPGTGIQLNNMLGEDDLNPAGFVPTPGRRLPSMMSPSLVLLEGRPRLVIGSAGSERLRGAIVQVIVNVVDGALPIAEAIEQPRIHLDGEILHAEPGIPGAALRELERNGYVLEQWAERNLYFGGVSAVAMRADGEPEACGDPRRGGFGFLVG
jgi:gamma-glutamyltranspeptidase/glutathione hydrolase